MKKKSIMAAIFCSLFLSIGITTAQQLTVTPSLTFGPTTEIAPDSLWLSISNNTGRAVTIFNMKFYPIYGANAFSSSSNWLFIPDGAVTGVWIRFSPRQNIYHNSELVIENDGLRGYVSVDLKGQGRFSKSYYSITENQEQEGLKNAITTLTAQNYTSLGYNVARDSMFMIIDNKRVNGQGATQNTIECIYTGRQAVGYTSRTDCQTNYAINTEHTFPQSLFASVEPMKSDLFHLFPTDDIANNTRGDNVFGVVSNPTWSNGGSRATNTVFEPRDAQKGRAARAMFYFVLRYQNYTNFLNSQEAILRQWYLQFPPDQIEQKRCDDIFRIQRNRNPFIDYPQFIERIQSFSNTSVAPVVKSFDIPIDTIVYGTVPVNTPATYRYVVVNTGNTPIAFSGFTLNRPSLFTFVRGGNDTTIGPGDALEIDIKFENTTADSVRGLFNYTTSLPSNVTVPIYVNDPVLTSFTDPLSTIRIYPNPSHDLFFLEGFSGTYYLTTMDGRTVIGGDINESATIDVSGLAKGIYLFNLRSRGYIHHERIVVE